MVQSASSKLIPLVRILVLGTACTAMIFPIYWMMLASIRSPETVYSDVWPIPRDPSFENYRLINDYINYNAQYVNSIIVSTAVMVITMAISTFVAYAIVRFQFRGRGLLTVALLFSYMFPPLLTLIPLYVIFVHMGIIGSLLSLIIAELAITLPLGIWLLWGFFKSMPFELEDAAMIDGCSRLGAFMRVILPLAKPGLMTVAIFSFLIAWNSFTAASILITTDANKTLPVGLQQIVSNMTANWGVAMAACAAIVLPLLIALLVLNRYFIQGLVGSGLKG